MKIQTLTALYIAIQKTQSWENNIWETSLSKRSRWVMEQSSGTENDFEKEQAKNAQVPSVHLLVGMSPFFFKLESTISHCSNSFASLLLYNENKLAAAGWRWGNMMITTPTPGGMQALLKKQQVQACRSAAWRWCRSCCNYWLDWSVNMSWKPVCHQGIWGVQ